MNLLRGPTYLFTSVERFDRLAQEDARQLVKPEGPQFERAARDIRRALGASLLLVGAAVLGGWATGLVLTRWVGPATRSASAVLQYAGVGLLLLDFTRSNT